MLFDVGHFSVGQVMLCQISWPTKIVGALTGIGWARRIAAQVCLRALQESTEQEVLPTVLGQVLS
jgi:hypothetical protein